MRRSPSEPLPARTPRKQRALDTRRRMVKAAYDLFCERGYSATTMQAIAARAGVAYQTLYFTFASKAQILSDAVGAGVVGFDRWTPQLGRLRPDDAPAILAPHGWWAGFTAEPDARRALAIFVDASLRICARVSPLVDVVITASASDPEMAAERIEGEARRVTGYRAVVRQLAKKGGLRPGLRLQRASDVVLTLVSVEIYKRLVHERGWSHAACRAWLMEALERELFPGRGRRRP